MKNHKENIGLALLLIVNLIGIVGFRSEFLLPYFKSLTPIN